MHALTLPLIDTDRMTPGAGGGGRLGARGWCVLAFVVFVAIWLVFRVNGYFVR